MSYPITLTSNKAEFQNYLSDNIKIKRNSEVCLTKTAMSIPVKVNQYVLIPYIEAANYADVAFWAIIDGIRHFIDWNNIYDAYTIIDTANGIEPITIDNFYSNLFRLPLNNFIIFRDPLTNIRYTRANISAVIAKAFDEKYLFYKVESHPVMKNLNVDEYSIPLGGQNLTINGTLYEVDFYQNYEMDLGFIASYSPVLLAPRVETVGAVWDVVAGAPTITNDANGTQIVTTTGDGTGPFDTIADNLQPVDPNGGFLAFTPSTVPNTTTICIGLTYSLGQGISTNITSVDQENMPIGVRLTKNATGDMYIQIFDGFDLITEPAADLNNPVLIPFDIEIVDALETDTYFLYFDRVGINSNNKYTYSFSVYKNAINANFKDGNTLKIYQSQNSYPNIPDMTPTILCDQTGVTISNIKQVNLTDDSLQQTDQNDGANLEPRAPTELASFNIQPGYDIHDTIFEVVPELEEFYEILGFVLGANPGTRINKVADVGNPFQYSISYERVAKASSTAINFGTNTLIDTLFVDEFFDGEEFIDYKNIGAHMPRFLDVKINDMAIRSLAGQLVGAQNTTTTSITRDVCHIPLPAEFLSPTQSFNLEISYEPYNLIYRQLFNDTEIPVNQFIMKISYKEFKTDKEVDIRDINGTLKIELHVKPV